MSQNLEQLKARNLELKKRHRALLAKMRVRFFLDWIRAEKRIRQLKKELYESNR